MLTGLAVFFIVKVMNKIYKKQEEAPAEPTPTEKLLAEIRDLLARENKQ